MQKERQIHNSILEYLSYKKDFTFYTYYNGGSYNPTKHCFIKSNSTSKRFERPDMSPLDIVGWYHKTGLTVWIEVKTEKTKPNPKQQAFIDFAKANGAYAFVARSIDDVIFHLNKIEG